MDETSQALQKIARGTGIVFFGTVFWLFFEFLSRTIIARHYSTSEYGVFNLALTVLSIALIIATLGFQNSLPREVAFYREKESLRVGDLISTALIIVALNSIIWVIVLILGAKDIAQIFHDSRLVQGLRIMAFALPFFALITVIIAISRGFGRVRELVYFQNIMYPLLFFILIVAGIFLNANYRYIFIAYLLSQSLTCLFLVLEVYKSKLFKLSFLFNITLARELVKFSIPLMFVGILNYIMGWTDTLMLGYYMSTKVVGLYNAASPLAKLLLLILSSAGFLYMPLASTLYAQGKIEEIRNLYVLLTKWIFLLTFPLFSLMFLLPDFVITIFFGPTYIPSSSALRILSVGFIFHVIFGLNGISLVVIKENKFMMYSNLFSAILNVMLNAVLIPHYGLNGAAVATAISYLVGNILSSLWLYKKSRIHPFRQDYLTALSVNLLLILFARAIISSIINQMYKGGLVLLLWISMFALLIATGSISKKEVLWILRSVSM
ncbi:flippase [Thermococcus sp.]